MTRNRTLFLPVCMALLILTQPASAQESTTGASGDRRARPVSDARPELSTARWSTPTTVADGALPLSRVRKVTVPRIDVKEVVAEDLLRRGQDLPPRYAIPTATRRTPATDGTWEDLGNGLHMWRLRVR